MLATYYADPLSDVLYVIGVGLLLAKFIIYR